jgi:hypothetical protein
VGFLKQWHLSSNKQESTHAKCRGTSTGLLKWAQLGQRCQVGMVLKNRKLNKAKE